jgi:hypothetical protein
MPWIRMGEWRYSFTILDIGTRWGWVVNFTPRPLYLRGKTVGTHWIGGWVGPRADLEAVEKNLFPCRDRTLTGLRYQVRDKNSDVNATKLTPSLVHSSVVVNAILICYCRFQTHFATLSANLLFPGILFRYSVSKHFQLIFFLQNTRQVSKLSK